MLPFKMFGFSAGVGEVALVALPALLALPAVIAVGAAAGFVGPGFPAITPYWSETTDSQIFKSFGFSSHEGSTLPKRRQM
jgi:hypothetical protein